MSSIVRLRSLLAGVRGQSIPVTEVLPAGVTVRARFNYRGTGTPEGIVTAAIGAEYINESGGASTTLYLKTSGVGNTGWTAK